MIDFNLTLTGTAQLLMHNSRLANPLDPATKALKKYTSKRQKTDEDHEALAHLEFLGSLYLDPDIGPYIPGENVFRALVDGAKLTKLGTKVTRGLFIDGAKNPLVYKGSRDAEILYKAGQFLDASVKVGMQRVMRRRPMFTDWKVQVEGYIDPSVLEVSDLSTISENAGKFIGLGDWRPRYGRFTAEIEAA